MGIHAEKQYGKYVLRTCHTVGEFRQVLQLQKDVWNFVDIELVPVRLFVVGEKIGGHVIGAWDGNELAGFAYGIPGYRNGHPYLHSHMLAVRPAHRNTGLGRAMKLFQRDICLEMGLELMEWTFDPLEIKNAFLNIEKLGAITRRYTVNQYGITSSPLQGGLPSDRLTAEWWLKSKRVQTLLETGHTPKASATETIEVPAEIAAWKANEATRARAAELQSKNRELFQKHFTAGLSVVGYERDKHGNGRFLLGKWDESWNY